MIDSREPCRPRRCMSAAVRYTGVLTAMAQKLSCSPFCKSRTHSFTQRSSAGRRFELLCCAERKKSNSGSWGLERRLGEMNCKTVHCHLHRASVCASLENSRTSTGRRPPSSGGPSWESLAAGLAIQCRAWTTLTHRHARACASALVKRAIAIVCRRSGPAACRRAGLV